MKKLILIMIVFSNNTLFFQSKLDSILLIKINKYRRVLKLNELKFDTILYKTAKLQASYQSDNSIVGHSQKESNKEDVYERFKFSGGSEDINNISEICSNISLNIHIDSLILEVLSNNILLEFKKSKDHNNILKSNKYNYIGISTIPKVNDSGFKKYKNHLILTSIVFKN